MGYFSNGTDGEMYYEEFCSHCIHEGNCTVWLAHQVHNYGECNNTESILDILIPRSGIHNQKCTMFVEGTKVYKGTPTPEMKQWLDKNGIISIKP